MPSPCGPRAAATGCGRPPGEEAGVAMPIEDDAGDGSDEAPPQGPSRRELRRQAAERGDVDFFLDEIRTKAWSMFSVGEVLRHLMRAAEVRARTDPEGYSRELFAKMV